MSAPSIASRLYDDFLMPSRLHVYRDTIVAALEHGCRIVSVEAFWDLLESGSVDTANRYLILRHDIDTDPATAGAFWDIDRSLGVVSSYYFRLSTLDRALMQAIHRAGGEASYHYEELATLAKERHLRGGQAALNAIPEAQALLEENVARLRRSTGLPFRTVASHGDFTNRRLRIPNWALLVDRGFRRRLGIELEAYDHAFMAHVTKRFSDSGPHGAWRPADAHDAILAEVPVIYLLVHPRQWRAGRRANLRNNLERVAEGVRYAVGASDRAGARAITVIRPEFETAARILPRRSDSPPHVLAIAVPPGYEPERRYVLDLVIREWLGLEYSLRVSADTRVEIALEGDAEGRRLFVPDILLATAAANWLTEASMPSAPLRRVRGLGVPPATDARGIATDGRRLLDPLPVPYGIADPGAPFAVRDDDDLGLTVDVFGSVFFLVTRYEEIARPAEDDHGRFPAYASLALIEGFLERPIVDELVELLWWAMRAQWPTLERRQTEFQLNPTHDVDQPWSVEGLSTSAVMRSLAGDILRRGDGELALRRARSILEAGRTEVTDDPFDTFDLLMEASERVGTRSTFYFQAAGRGSTQGPSYDLSSPRIARLLRRIHERGHLVGLHGSYESHLSVERLADELRILTDACRASGIEQGAWGGRQHYLRFSVPATWRAQAAAGLASDSTVGFADAVGFRASTCRSYPVFDLRERRALGLRERPVIVMDVTLLGYLGLDASSAACRVRSLVKEARAHGGEATLCYHNSTLIRRRDQGRYRELLQSLADGSA